MLPLALVLLAATAQPAEYELPVTRDGKTVTRVAQSFWPGEYPGPVVNVTVRTTVKAFASVRDLSAAADCTVKPGIYHTWARNAGSAIGYFTIMPVVTYVAKADITADEIAFKAGDQLTDVVPLSEGSCRGQHVSGKSKKGVEFGCDTIDTTLTKTTTSDDFYEQWVHLQCVEGHKAFVRDEALLKAPGAKAGQILGYGKVGP